MSAGFDAVWFDLDGTLVDSRDGVGWALTEAVRELLPDVALPPITPHIGPPIPDMLARLLPEYPEAHTAISTGFRRRYDEEGGWERTSLFPGIREALDDIRAAGVRMDVVTNKRSLPTARILDRCGLAPFLTTAVSPDTRAPAYRSKAEAMSALLRESGIDPRRLAYVGDTDGDREAARLLGCSFVWVEWGFGGTGARSCPEDLAAISRAQQLPVVLLSPRHEL